MEDGHSNGGFQRDEGRLKTIIESRVKENNASDWVSKLYISLILTVFHGLSNYFIKLQICFSL